MRDTHTIEIEVGNTRADVTLALDITDASFSHAFGIKEETDVELNEDATTIEKLRTVERRRRNHLHHTDQKAGRSSDRGSMADRRPRKI